MSPDPIILGAYTARVVRLELAALVILLALLVAWCAPDLLAWFHGLPPVGAP